MPPVDQFELELLSRQLPTGRLIDLDLGSSTIGRATADELSRWSADLAFTYVRCGHVGTQRAFRDMLRGRLSVAAASGAPDEVVVVISARTSDQWPERARVVREVAIEFDGLVIVPVVLPRHGVLDPDEAKRLVATAVLTRWGLLAAAPQVPTAQAGLVLGASVREAAGCEPFVLAVCGNETQQRASAAFPGRLAAEFGIEGQWLLTDYGRPGRVVEEIREIHERLGDRLVAVIFSQLFNATDVKRGGQAYLREHGVLSITRDFKSTGSALSVTRQVLTMYLSGETDEPDAQPEPEPGSG